MKLITTTLLALTSLVAVAGYFATKESFKNYVLKFEGMYERPEGLEADATFRGNSGLLIHSTPPLAAYSDE